MPQPTYLRIKRLTRIYLAVQLFLLVLLLVMSLQFQTVFYNRGIPQVFFNSIIASVILQLITFYPLKRLAEKEARLEVGADAGTLTAAQQKGLRQSRMFYDYGKVTIFLFFAAFVALAPEVTFVLSTIYFTFILISLTYFQCFNYSAKKAIKG